LERTEREEALEAEIRRISNVIERAGTGIPQGTRPPHDWLAQVLLVLLFQIGILEQEVDLLRRSR
jgi:hypothetical protein